MRLLAIGDIHGCSRAFDTLLDAVAPKPDDQIITLGDYVDRGPDSRGVLDRLVALHDTGRLIALRGNHDVMMLEARKGRGLGWLAGRRQTDAAFLRHRRRQNRRDPHQQSRCAAERRGLVRRSGRTVWQRFHSGTGSFSKTTACLTTRRRTYFRPCQSVYPDLPLEEQPDYMLYWEKLVEPMRPRFRQNMICGHTRQKSGLPLDWAQPSASIPTSTTMAG